MSDSEADDDPMLRSMRSVWVSMRDEEPPASGLDALLAAARSKAEEMKPREPWWRRALATLTRPPVLAMAGLVLVIGGAVLIQRRGESLDATATHVRDHAEELDRAPAPVQGAKPEVVVEKTKAAADPGGSGEAAAIASDELRDRPRTQPVPSRRPRARVPAPDPAPVSEPVTEPRPEDSEDHGGGGAPAGADEGKLQVAQEGGKTAPPPREPTVDATPTVTLGGTTRAPSTAQVPTDQLIAQARTAAELGDCAAARVTAARVQKQDPIAYRDRLVKIPAVARCLK